MSHMRLKAGLVAHGDNDWHTCPWKLMRSWGVHCAPLPDRSAAFRWSELDGETICLYRVEPWYPHLNLYAALAEHLGIEDASEIYLPTEIARTTPLVVIETQQKHVSRKMLQDKFTSVRGSDFQFRLRA